MNLVNTPTKNLLMPKEFTLISPLKNKLLLEAFETTSTRKLSLKNLLETLLGDTTQKKQTLLETLLNNPSFKSLTNTQKSLQDLQTILPNLKDIATLKPKELQKLLFNSGIFLESKLQKGEHSLKEDIKAKLLQKEQQLQTSNNPQDKELLKNVQKLLLQIEYFQALNYLSDENYILLPFLWKELKEAKLKIKQKKQNHFFCSIDLELETLSKITINLLLVEEKQLDITLFCDTKKLQEFAQKNFENLKTSLYKEGILLKNFKVSNFPKQTYPQNNTIELGVDIKV